jgi:hypothetical protein
MEYGLQDRSEWRIAPSDPYSSTICRIVCSLWPVPRFRMG